MDGGVLSRHLEPDPGVRACYRSHNLGDLFARYVAQTTSKTESRQAGFRFAGPSRSLPAISSLTPPSRKENPMWEGKREPVCFIVAISSEAGVRAGGEDAADARAHRRRQPFTSFPQAQED